MSGGGKTQPAGQVTSTNAPAPWALPYISTALGQANNLLAGGGPQYYPGNMVAGFSQPQQAAMAGIDKLAQKGTTAGNAGTNFDAGILNGNFTGPQAELASMGANGGGTNPYLDQTFKLAAGATQGQLASEFGGAGRNVDASQPLRAEQLNNLATSIYGGAYDANQNRALAANSTLGGEQAGALAAAPGLNSMAFGNLGQELGVGGMVQNQAQNQIGADVNKYNYYQNLPYSQLGQYEGFLSGVQPGSQSSNPYFTNPAGNLLGMFSSGLGIYNSGSQAGLWGSGKPASGGGGGSATGGAPGYPQ